MLRNIQVVAGSVATMFLLMAVGFFLTKRGMMNRETQSRMSKLLLYVVAPCIMIDTLLAEERGGETLHRLLVAGAALAATYALNIVLIQLCYRRKNADDRGVLRFASIYGNTGFMGIPLIQSVLGSSGMLVAVTSLAVFNITTWTHGNYQIGGRSQLSVKKAVLNPGVLGFLIAIALFLLNVELPGPVASAVSYLGSMNTPLAMIVIGSQMAEVDFRTLLKDGRLYVGSAVKLLVIPAINMLVLLPFGLDEVTYLAIVILAGCPVAGATALFSQMNGKDPSLAARLVTLSTILCIITLPLMSTVARLLLGL